MCFFLSFDSPKERNTRPNESFDSGGKKKRPQKPTSIFSFTQKSLRIWSLEKMAVRSFCGRQPHPSLLSLFTLNESKGEKAIIYFGYFDFRVGRDCFSINRKSS
jgi:hypothetical protein